MGTTVGMTFWVLMLAALAEVPHNVLAGWQDGVKSSRIVTLDNSAMYKFLGNTTHDDHFKELLLMTDAHILVGGRNVIYTLSTVDLSEIIRFEWHPDSSDKNMCYIKRGSDEDCDNYIRVLIEKNYGEYLICGTNAYKPLCGDFTITVLAQGSVMERQRGFRPPQDGVMERKREFSGRGSCPYDYRRNSTSVYVDDQLYVGTVADFAGLEPLIYREPLRTEQYDLKTLNEPNFVKSMALGDYVYFFFRETAAEYMNCGKASYSRVARVCRHDKGGPHKFRNKWTSYLKSRLSCSVAGDIPFYFNEIQSVSGPLEGRYGNNAQTLIYGIFTTPENSLSGSAVCAFTFQDIMDSFEGPFKTQESVNANWLPLPASRVPEPRPGQCVKDSSMLPDLTLNFTKHNSLMDEEVLPFYNQPILINTNAQSSGRFTSIVVDPQVRTPDGKYYDVLFIGTDNGKVLKAINTQSHDSYEKVDPFIIEELEVFEPGTPILSLKIIRPRTKEPRLLVTSSSQIHSIPLWRCNTDKIILCGDCLALRDPYCMWDKKTQQCIASVINDADAIQSVVSGTHGECTETNQADRTQLFDSSVIHVNPNSAIQLDCGIKRGDYKFCVWEKGSDTFIVEDVYEGVYNGLGRPENTEGNQCGIVINSATIEDHGIWTCKIYKRGVVLEAIRNVTVTGAPTPSSRSVHFAP